MVTKGWGGGSHSFLVADRRAPQGDGVVSVGEGDAVELPVVDGEGQLGPGPVGLAQGLSIVAAGAALERLGI
ncbi:MAG: hypothetical protein ABR579_02965 [Actinomycetota bacterium]